MSTRALAGLAFSAAVLRAALAGAGPADGETAPAAPGTAGPASDVEGLGELLREAARERPASWREAREKYLRIAETLLAMDLYGESREWLELALARSREEAAKDPAAEVLLTVAELEFRLGRHEAALEAARGVSAAAGADPAARGSAAAIAARSMQRLGRWEDLASHAAGAARTEGLAPGERAWFLLKRADALWELRRFEDAAAAYVEAGRPLPADAGLPALIERRARAAAALHAAALAKDSGLLPREAGAEARRSFRLILEDDAGRVLRVVAVDEVRMPRGLEARAFADQLFWYVEALEEHAGPEPPQPLLGILMTQPVSDAGGAAPARGVTIERVLAGSPAEKAGLAAGDVIAGVGGEPVGPLGPYQIQNAVRRAGPGARLRITVRRGEETFEAEAVLAGEEDAR